MKLHPLLILAAIPILVAAPPSRVTDDELERFERLIKPQKNLILVQQKAMRKQKPSTKPLPGKWRSS